MPKNQFGNGFTAMNGFFVITKLFVDLLCFACYKIVQLQWHHKFLFATIFLCHKLLQKLTQWSSTIHPIHSSHPYCALASKLAIFHRQNHHTSHFCNTFGFAIFSSHVIAIFSFVFFPFEYRKSRRRKKRGDPHFPFLFFSCSISWREISTNWSAKDWITKALLWTYCYQ